MYCLISIAQLVEHTGSFKFGDIVLTILTFLEPCEYFCNSCTLLCHGKVSVPSIRFYVVFVQFCTIFCSQAFLKNTFYPLEYLYVVT